MKRGMLAVLAVAASSAFGCGGGGSPFLEEPRQPDVSFVYGYLDMKAAPTNVSWLQLKRLSPPSETPYYNFRVFEGTFYGEFVPPGSYVLSSFGGAGGPFTKDRIYEVAVQESPFRLTVDKPGFYFAGTWKYVPVHTSFFEQAKFGIEPAPSPGAKEVLQKIYPFSKGTVWQSRIASHLATLQ